MPNLRRLLAALLVALLVGGASSLVGPGSAAAAAPCTCAAPGVNVTVEEHVRTASAVFIATVDDVVVLGGNPQDGFSRLYTVTVATVYKPKDYELITTPTAEVMTPGSFADCADVPVQGQTYMFFVESNEGFTADGCGGTSLNSTKLTTQVENFLGAGRSPVPPEPPTATFTSVNTDEPTSLTRVAAPGLALVLIGLLGLTVVRRLGRAR